MNARGMFLAGVWMLCIGLAPIDLVAGTGPTDPGPVPARLRFSTEVSFTATGGPHAGQLVSDGDELSPMGVIVHTNQDLAGAFCQQPPFFDVGLDALHHRRDGRILFSAELGWFDECLGVQVSPGDLLANNGTIVRTNAQLMANFNPKPVVPDVGLDAVHELFFGELYFSTENDIFDEFLGVVLKHGDVLSDAGYVVATNEYLLRNFCIKPVFPDMGLDALFVPGNGEFWFSTEEGFFDECGLGVISDGDLLSDAGYVVATNRQLTAGFFSPNDPGPKPLGLDATWIDLCEPFSGCGTLQFGPQGCPIFVPQGGGANFYFVENTGPFGPGDRVWVTGCLNPFSQICPPFTAPGIENNTIARCFEGCGTLGPAPHGCTNPLLYTDDGQLYALENVDGFTFDDRVFVRGRVNEESLICFPPFNPTIEENTIAECQACCFADGNCALMDPAECEALGGLPQGTGSQCGDLSCLQACCYPDGTCADLPPGDCAATGGQTQGLGSSCTNSLCPQPEACCLLDGSCQILQVDECNTIGGTPQGPGTTCDAVACPLPEACCFDSDVCQDFPPQYCLDQGGDPQGPGTACATTICPAPQACCFDDGTCQDLRPAECLNQGGRPQGPGTSCSAADACPPAAQIVSVCSMKIHRPVPGPAFPCCLPVIGEIPGELTEPRISVLPNPTTTRRGIDLLRIEFDQPLNDSAFGLNEAAVHIAETTTAIYPLFQPYSGMTAITTGGAGNVLILNFDPGLENARAYRFRMSQLVTSLPGQGFDIRGLIADVNSDGAVNATDRSVVVGVWTGSGFTCETDIKLDAQTNATDRSLVIGAWTSGMNTAP